MVIEACRNLTADPASYSVILVEPVGQSKKQR
jgi:hypothetical protein